MRDVRSGLRPIALAGCLLAAIAATAAQRGAPPPGQAPDPQRPVFRAGAHFVRVDAFPTRNGRIVEGLTAEDFEVLEDGRPQVVETLAFVTFRGWEPDDEPLNVWSKHAGRQLAADPTIRVFVIYLDTYHVGREGTLRARDALLRFVAQGLGPRDLVAVVTPRQVPDDLAFRQDSSELQRYLTMVPPWGVREEPTRDPVEQQLEGCFGPGEPGRGQNRVIATRRFDQVLTDLENLVAMLGSIREERKNLILVSDGWNRRREYDSQDGFRGQPVPGLPTGPRPPGGPGRGSFTPPAAVTETNRIRAFCNHELARLSAAAGQFMLRFRELGPAAVRANVAFYPVVPAPEDLFNDPTRVFALRNLADDSGGLSIGTNDPAQVLARVLDHTRAYYVLGYHSSNMNWDGQFRTIDVRVRQRGVEVTARRHYRAPTELEIAARDGRLPPPEVTDVDLALLPLNRLRETTELFVRAATRGGEAIVVAELAAALASRPAWREGAVVRATALDESGGTVSDVEGAIDAGRRSVLLRLPVAGGTVPARVRVEFAGRGETLADTVAVAREADATAGTPILFRAAPAPSAAYEPVADLQVPRQSRVRVEWLLPSAPETRDARLLGRDGRALGLPVSLTAREDPRGTLIVADLTLGPLAPGDYLVALTLGPGADESRHLVAFRVVR